MYEVALFVASSAYHPSTCHLAVEERAEGRAEGVNGLKERSSGPSLSRDGRPTPCSSYACPVVACTSGTPPSVIVASEKFPKQELKVSTYLVLVAERFDVGDGDFGEQSAPVLGPAETGRVVQGADLGG